MSNQVQAITAYRDTILAWRFASTLNTDPAPDGDGEAARAWAQREKQRLAAMDDALTALLHTGFDAPANWHFPTEIGRDVVALERFLREVKVATGKLRSAPTPPPALTGSAAEAARIIDAEPGLPGKTIAKRLGCEAEHFRSRIVPKLKAHGYHNSDGYRPPM